MPLPLPNLDNRSWSDLVEQGTALIPSLVPRWTDQNFHDPGRTLAELFAWLTEVTIYRLNRVPERHLRKFLKLVEFSPNPPRASRGFLELHPDSSANPLVLPSGVEFESTKTMHRTRFRTLREVTVSPASLTDVCVDTGDGNIVDVTSDWKNGEPIAPFGRKPRVDASLHIGFEKLTPHTPLSIVFRFERQDDYLIERERLLRESDAQAAACRPVIPDIVCEDPQLPSKKEGTPLPAHHSVRLAWEAFTGPASHQWTRLAPVTGRAPTAGEVWDDTRSLTLDGIVEMNVPPGVKQTTLGGRITPARYFVRIRLEHGAYDAPPVLRQLVPNAAPCEQVAPQSQTFHIPTGVSPGGSAPTAGKRVGLNMQLTADGAIKALTFDVPGAPVVTVLRYKGPTSTPGEIALDLIKVGIGNGMPWQRVILPRALVQVESLKVYTHDGNVWEEWKARDDFDSSTRIDFHFVLDPTTGIITFGDGERGRTPRKGALILAAYCATQSAAGNIAEGPMQLAETSDYNEMLLGGLSPSLRVNLLGPAEGGQDAEPVRSAIGRAVETLHAHDRLLELSHEARTKSLDQVSRRRVLEVASPTRAVNVLDLERLALEVPGTRVARARAWPSLHPDYPCLNAPGVITVVVVPDASGPEPTPSHGLLTAVKQFLNRRRMICTRLETVGPQYLEVSVTAQVRMRFGGDANRVKERILAALNKFLDPLRGGPDELGWPFGRDVHCTEILQLIDGVHCVDHVLALRLSIPTGEPSCGDVRVCPTWLVTPGKHRIEVVSSISKESTRWADLNLPECEPDDERERDA